MYALIIAIQELDLKRKNVNCVINLSDMSTIELRERLIEKIKKTDNENILAEVYRLLGLETDDTEIYTFSDDQKKEIDANRLQIKQRQFLTNDEANKEIDEWLSK